MLNNQGEKNDAVLKLGIRLGLFDLAQTLFPEYLTVLNYHRIEDPSCDQFSTFKPNVSASPAMFELQMDYLADNYNVVSATDVVAWITNDRPLPPRAALITFDDGYFDNYTNAFPILRKHNLPAVIFLASNSIESASPFYWDLIAYCFHKSQADHLKIPMMGIFSWNDVPSRDSVVRSIVEALKTMPELDKKRLTDSFPELLNVSVPNELFRGMFLTWSQVREMSNNGIEMGAHTANHPILTRISPDDARVEIISSKMRIEDEIGSPIHSFAYPNGQRTDFDEGVITAVKDSGLQASYTLLPGPTRFDTVKNRPYQIRRIFLSYKDTFPRFVGKLSGLSRIFP